MGLNIKNRDVERLIDEVARLTGETKTEAVRRSLEERRLRLSYHRASRDRAARLTRFLETEVWPLVPAGELGRKMTKAEEEELLGYGGDSA
ncbi:MAG: type II toxin-antitoxin system VapB family antitoxin [Gemmatimonadota bacterium]